MVCKRVWSCGVGWDSSSGVTEKHFVQSDSPDPPPPSTTASRSRRQAHLLADGHARMLGPVEVVEALV